MINLEGKTVTECCEIVAKEQGHALTSEFMQWSINEWGGPFVKVSTVERKCRGSDKIRGVKVPGKNYVKYAYKG